MTFEYLADFYRSEDAADTGVGLVSGYYILGEQASVGSRSKWPDF